MIVISKIHTAYFYVAEVMASMAIKTSVHQHCIQDVDNRFAIWLRHVWSDIEILRIFHILHRQEWREEQGVSFPKANHPTQAGARQGTDPQSTIPHDVPAET